MRIVLSNYRYFMSGGPEKYLFSVDRLLREKGHEVFPFSVRSPLNLKTPHEASFLSPVGAGGETYFSEYRRDPRTMLKVLSRQVYSTEGYFKARDYAKQVKADIAYSIQFLNKMSPAVLDGFKSAGIPVVQRISDFGLICPQAHMFDGKSVCEACLRGSFVPAVRKKCVMGSRTASLIKAGALALQRLIGCNERIDAFVFPSQFTRRKFIEAGFPEAKLFHVPTPVETSAIVPQFEGGKTFLYFGRVTPEKGVDTLLRAYKKMKGPKPRLLVVGVQTNTPYSAELSERYREVQFYPFMTEEKLSPLIRDALCIMTPATWYENLPNVALEAFAHGKPVLAPKHGSFLELLKDGQTGVVYDPGNEEDLCEKMEWVAANPSAMAEKGRAARELVASEYSSERHYEALNAIIRTLSGSG
jgi:glycosyltransferase involved in cell wall biosynthesis